MEINGAPLKVKIKIKEIAVIKWISKKDNNPINYLSLNAICSKCIEVKL
jgi:hypothetical protein